MSQNAFLDIPHAINGDTVIAFTDVKTLKTMNYLDSARVSTYLMDHEGQPHTKYLGMINLMASTHQQPLPIMKDMFENSAVLEVDPNQTITYDLPVDRESDGCYTAVDTSEDSPNPGIDGTVFKLILNHQYSKGTTLTYSLKWGMNVMVSNAHSVEQHGDNWLHYVVLAENSKAESFPKEFLKKNIQWFKVDHILGEYETDYSNISMMKPPMATLTNEFVLGDKRGVETFMTEKASRMYAPALAEYAKGTMERMSMQMEVLGKNSDVFFMAKIKNQGGKIGIDKSTVKVDTTLSYFGLAELAMMESISLTYSEGGTFRAQNGGTKRRNEGIWRQMRRGKIIKYARPGGITLNHLMEASSYIFKNSSIAPNKRRLKFRVGSMAEANMFQLIREHAITQLTGLPQGMLGTDAQIKPVFSGPLNDLKMQEVIITGATLPGVGMVELELDPTLDFDYFSDRSITGFYGGSGYADTSYSMVIYDATLPYYSNVEDVVRGAKLIEGGKTNANIYYIKPKGSNITYGHEQGRMQDEGQFERVVSSSKIMGKSFWAHNQSEALMLDTTRYITIELQITGNRR